MRGILVAAATAAAVLAFGGGGASAQTRHCSPSGDVCYGAFGTGATVRLKITLAAHYFTRYTLCVRAPGGRRDCRRFRVHAIAHGMYESSVAWARHFPNRGPGRYGATWNWGSGPTKPVIVFREGPSINVSPAAVHPGGRLRVFGLAGGCTRGDQVTLISKAFSPAKEFAGVPAVFTPVLAGDRYSVRTRIPANRRPGRYTISARCGGANLGVTGRLRVVR